MTIAFSDQEIISWETKIVLKVIRTTCGVQEMKSRVIKTGSMEIRTMSSVMITLSCQIWMDSISVDIYLHLF
jgi:hypothetical protein